MKDQPALRKELQLMEVRKERSEKKSPKSRPETIGKLLTKMRKDLLAEISASRLPSSPPSTDIGDLADQASDERDRELSLLLTGREKEKLLAVDEALEKLNQGTYGICEECGDPIKPSRLRAVPLAKLCAACQSRLEKEIGLRKEEEPEPGSPDPDLVREVWEEERE